MEVQKGYVDRQTAWICIQKAVKGRSWFKYDTISWSRKISVQLLIGKSTMTWDECKRAGWICKKVTIDITV